MKTSFRYFLIIFFLMIGLSACGKDETTAEDPDSDLSDDVDTDGDGMNDDEDTDDDNDGTVDADDSTPTDTTVDSDNDGVPNSEDEDDDGDGTPDIEDDFAADASKSVDSDGDGTDDANDTDDDNDGILDTEDCGTSTSVIYYADADGDGYGDTATSTTACTAPTGYVTDNTDCNDSSALANPGVASETCDDSLDNDCNGTVDDPTTFYADADSDSYGDAATSTTACTTPTGYVTDNTDCNDASDASSPALTEICDSIDNNCDGSVDEGVLNTYYLDADGDTYGVLGTTTEACSVPTGYAPRSGDCKDSDSAIYPKASETCNKTDDNCDGLTDNVGSSYTGSGPGSGTLLTYYGDKDGDTYGNDSKSIVICSNSTAVTRAKAQGYVATGGDCDDTVATTYPGATESCDNVDNDCDDSTDEDSTFTDYYTDADGDSYGDASATATSLCSATSGYATTNTDCNDADATIYPGATESCDDSVDSDCDGSNDPTSSTTCYADSDGDGYGDPNTTQGASACSGSCESGYVTDGTDCDDDNSLASTDCPDLAVFEELDGPCDDATSKITELVFVDDENGWATCSDSDDSNMGVFYTNDGATSWTKISTDNDSSDTDMTEFHGMDVFVDTADGNKVYICGYNDYYSDSVYVYLFTPASGSNNPANGTVTKFVTENEISTSTNYPCYSFGKVGNNILYASGNDMVYSSDGGSTWATDDYWADSTSTYGHGATELQIYDSQFYAVGSSLEGYVKPSYGNNNVSAPYFYSPNSTTFYQLEKHLIHANVYDQSGEGNTAESPIEAFTIPAANHYVYVVNDANVVDENLVPTYDSIADKDAIASGKIFYSTDMSSWSQISIESATEDLFTEDTDTANDYAHYFCTGYEEFKSVECSSSAGVCFAVGIRTDDDYGFILYSKDNGATWTELLHEDLMEDWSSKMTCRNYTATGYTSGLYLDQYLYYDSYIYDNTLWIVTSDGLLKTTIE